MAKKTMVIDLEAVGTALRERRESLGLSQGSLALSIERSQAWVSQLERGLIDPRELPNTLLRSLLSTCRWSLEDMAKATGLDFPGVEPEESASHLKPIHLEVHGSKEEIALALPELQGHRRRDLMAFRDEGVLAVVSRVDDPVLGEWMGIELKGDDMVMRRLTGYNRQGKALIEEEGTIAPLADGARILGRVVLRIQR